MKLISLSHLLFASIIGMTSVFFTDLSQVLSFFAGAGLIHLSYLILAISWTLIFQKKLIALAVILIIFKYAILGVILFQVVKSQWLDLLWFSFGIASFITAALTFAVNAARKKEE